MELVKYNNNSISSVTALGSLSAGGLNLLATNNITSGVSSSSFTSNIDSTYDTYLFKFINIHNSAQASFTFQTSTDSGSNYNTTITSTVFNTFHREDGSATSLSYQTGDDQAQGTSFQFLYGSSGTQNDNGNSGEIFLFSPSNTTFVKNFFTNFNFMSYHSPAYTQNYRCAGYFNTTSAIDAIQFKMSSGNIDSGVIKMYGITK
tara:strand:- start:19 stop:630 length:612 start_codon:yes stop_codon:yes gene_type:complete